MKTRWHSEPLISQTNFWPIALLSFAVFVAAAPQAARAQGIVRLSREADAPAAARNNVVPPPPLVFNAATLPVAVLDKALALNAEQKATIGSLQTALQAERQAVSALRVAPPQSAVADANLRQNATTNANPISTGGAAEAGIRLAESVAVSPSAQAVSAQAEGEAFLRLQGAELALARNEQTTVRKIRALLTMEQITQLKTTESDAALFDAVGLPVELLGQIVLTPDERTAVTAVFKTARRQFQRATRQSDRDAAQNDAYTQSLAALAPQNKTVAEAFLKARPATQATPATETQK